MEDGKRLETESGTVQGGLISPVLANVYLHYTLDTWFDYVKKHEFKGEMYMVRYADDFVCLFQYENEARKVLSASDRKTDVNSVLKLQRTKAEFYHLADTREQRNPLTFSALHTTMRQVTGGSTVYCIEQAGRS